MAADDLMAEHVWIGDGDRGPAPGYLAQPIGTGPYPGVVVLHHRAGLDAGSREITRRFAAEGFLTIAPDLHYRVAPEATMDEAAAIVQATGGPADKQVVADVSAAMAALRLRPSLSGRIGVVGFCSGGRQAFMAAALCAPDAVVMCYGARMVERTALSNELRPVVPITLADRIACPVRSFSGAEDVNPSPGDIAEIDAALTEAGVDHKCDIVEAAGHAFFDAYRDTYRPAAVLSVWPQIIEFLRERL